MLIILFFIMILFSIIGIISTKVLLNPVTLYNVLWLGVISLYQLRLSKLQDELSIKGILLLIIPIVAFNLVYYIITLVRYLVKSSYKRVSYTNKELNLFFNSKIIYNLFKFWFVIEILEIIYSKGLPIIWKLTGNSKTYMDFGIPTIHGFMNALGLVIIMLAFYYLIVINQRDTKMKIIIFIMFVLYTCMITRQVLISAIIQIFTIYIVVTKKVNWKKFFIVSIISIIVFGILGNIRTGYKEFLNVALIETNINKNFIGIYWIYMYLTMTVANINSIANMVFENLGLYPIASSYLPSVIRNIFFYDTNKIIPNYLVTQAFNVSGYYIDFYLGFKYLGVAIIGGIYGFIGSYLFNKVKNNKNNKYIIYYAVYLQIILLSFFYNHLLYLPSGFQFVVIYLIYKLFKREKYSDILT